MLNYDVGMDDEPDDEYLNLQLDPELNDPTPGNDELRLSNSDDEAEDEDKCFKDPQECDAESDIGNYVFEDYSLPGLDEQRATDECAQGPRRWESKDR